MKTQIVKRLLLCAAFFISAAQAAEVPLPEIPEYLPAKKTTDTIYSCNNNYGVKYSGDISGCIDAMISRIDPGPPEDQRDYPVKYTVVTNFRSVDPVGDGRRFNIIYDRNLRVSSTSNGQQVWLDNWTYGILAAWATDTGKTETYTCPPESFPDYTKGPITAADGTENVCLPKFPTCPLGYFKYQVNGTCVPADCPASGTQVDNIKDFKNKVPFGQSGTYCDGLCAYSVNAASKSSQGSQWVTGVSLGASCGQSPGYDNYYTPGNEDDKCQTHDLGAGGSFIACQEGDDDDTTEPPPEDDLDLTASEQNDDELPEYEGVNCTTSEDAITCVGSDLKETMNHLAKERERLDKERHNKTIDAEKEIAEWQERKAAERELSRKEDTQRIVDGLTALQGSGSVGGGGTDQGVVNAIEELGDGLNDTDVETDLEPSQGLEGFYEKQYPNGFQDVWNNNKDAIYNTAMIQTLEQWRVNVGGGSAPPMELCFNLGSHMNFGCSTFEIDSRIYSFLYVIIMCTAAFTSRAIIFGG
ncbi:hypothetical protein ACNPK9_05290 [Shewanella algae]|uniref:hypothetical protein n=2 Tax=Shewanella algae TaxID=38313 RepID=UPI003AAA34F5